MRVWCFMFCGLHSNMLQVCLLVAFDLQSTFVHSPLNIAYP